MLVLIAVYLGVARLMGLGFYQDAGMVLLVFILTGLVLIGAVWGVFVRPWWVYVIASSLVGLAVLAVMFVLIDVIAPGTGNKMGPGATVFLLPMLAFFFAYPMGGVAQWVLGLMRPR